MARGRSSAFSELFWLLRGFVPSDRHLLGTTRRWGCVVAPSAAISRVIVINIMSRSDMSRIFTRTSLPSWFGFWRHDLTLRGDDEC